MKFFTFGDIAGYSAGSCLVLISQVATGLTAVIGLGIAVVTLCIQIRRWRRGD